MRDFPLKKLAFKEEKFKIPEAARVESDLAIAEPLVLGAGGGGGALLGQTLPQHRYKTDRKKPERDIFTDLRRGI